MVQDFINELNNYGDITQAQKMSAYMQNKFKFLGISKPKLNELMRPFIKETSKELLDWDIVFYLWNIDFREAQYIAIEYLNKHKKQLVPNDIEKIKELIVTKSWWETVDSLDSLVGELVSKDETLKHIVLIWSTSDNIWLRRVSIDYQQKFKEKTDIKILEEVIVNNLNSKEFFINKAIGWSLREYGKTNPNWVKNFIECHKNNMASLSIKEALKLM